MRARGLQEMEVRRGRGLQFDPVLLDVFLEKMLGEEKQTQEVE